MLKLCFKSQKVIRLILAGCIFLFISLMLFYGSSRAGEPTNGSFYLVSCGVGDVDLITLRALDTIEKSDVIVCREKQVSHLKNYLKNKVIIDSSLSGWRTYGKDCSQMKTDAEKTAYRKHQESRGGLIAQIRQALNNGKTVSVLGSGDLLIYGGPYRWYLEEFADVYPQIIPGVSCLNAANAALGKDIMLGKHSHSAVMTTVREIDKFAAHHPTMIIFTMHTEFEKLIAKLKQFYPADTPIAIVFYAGYKNKQHVTRGTLNTILEQTEGKSFPFEHLVYVGDFMR